MELRKANGEEYEPNYLPAMMASLDRYLKNNGAGWLAGWLAGGLAGWRAGGLAGWRAGGLAGWRAGGRAGGRANHSIRYTN